MNNVDLKATSAKPRPKKPTDCGDIAQHQYVKGASVLHMLRKLLGHEVFQRGIRRYVADNKDKSVESEALRAALEAESKTDLKWFFDQWVYGSGFPELAVATSWSESDGLRVVVRQTQPVTKDMPVFRIPIKVRAVVAPSGDVTSGQVDFTGEMTQAAQEFVVPCPMRPAAVLFDPERSLLARVRELKPRA